MELKDCPFCYERRFMRALNKIQYCQLHGESSQSFRVGCNNPSCPVQPKVSAGDAHQKGGEAQARREAEELWNKCLSNPAEAALMAHVNLLRTRLSEALAMLEEFTSLEDALSSFRDAIRQTEA